MLLFSVHPEPEGRKVDKMLTLKKVKEMVKAPAHTKRVPSPKVLLEEGRIFLRKEFEHGSHLTLYHNGYVWFSAGKRNTVFHIHDCRGDYAYGASKGKGEVIKEEYFENCEWHIRALFEGEQRVEESQLKCEGVGQTKVCVSYHAVAEDWGEMADSEINVLDNSETDLIYPAELQEEEQYRRYFKEALELEILEQGYPADKAVLYEILELLVETVTSRKKFLRICGEEKPKEVVKSRLMKLDSSHIQYILECLKENSTQIRNIKQYLLATLYNAPVTVDSYYSAQVRHEFGWGGRVDRN